MIEPVGGWTMEAALTKRAWGHSPPGSGSTDKNSGEVIPMNNRTVLTALATAILAGGLVAGDAAAQQKVAWNLSTFGPPREVTRGYEYMAEYVKEHSGGNFTIEIHYGESLSPARQHLDGLTINAFEAAHFCTSYHPGKNPIGTVLDLPFLPIHSHEQLRDVHEAFFEYEPAKAELARWNSKYMLSTVLPLYEFMGIGDPPKRLEDWNGMRVRALGGMGDAMRKLGAVPTTVTAPEVYTSLERRVIQAASFPYSYTFNVYKLDEISSWFTEGMAIGTVNCPAILNLKAYEALPAEWQQQLHDAKAGAYEAYREAYGAADERLRPMYASKMTKVTYSDEERARFIEIAGEPVWQEWVERMKDQGVPNSQEVLDFVLETAEAKAGS